MTSRKCFDIFKEIFPEELTVFKSLRLPEKCQISENIEVKKRTSFCRNEIQEIPNGRYGVYSTIFRFDLKNYFFKHMGILLLLVEGMNCVFWLLQIESKIKRNKGKREKEK